jgi:uncharacterized protein YgiM (DUF1202 family)
MMPIIRGRVGVRYCINGGTYYISANYLSLAATGNTVLPEVSYTGYLEADTYMRSGASASASAVQAVSRGTLLRVVNKDYCGTGWCRILVGDELYFVPATKVTLYAANDDTDDVELRTVRLL